MNTGNTALVPEFISPGYVEVYNNKQFPSGIEGAVMHIKGVRQTYPDLALTVGFQIAEGDYVATCYTMRGTHAGTWMGIHPTGREIAVTGVNIDNVVDGKIVEHGGAANLFEVLLDIRAIRVAGADPAE